MTATPVATTVDVIELTRPVRETTVGPRRPTAPFRVESGRSLARRLGYDGRLLAAVPAAALDAFAGVGNPLRLARLYPGERVLGLGSGSGTDLFAAALCVGPTGLVVGRAPTGAELAGAEDLRTAYGFDNVELSGGPIESLPFTDGSFDAVISNGAVNRSADPASVIDEVARVLRPGGRLAVSDIVAAGHLSGAAGRTTDPRGVGPGGAAGLEEYRELITRAGFEVLFARRNDHAIVSARAAGATEAWDVVSVTILASRR